MIAYVVSSSFSVDLQNRRPAEAKEDQKGEVLLLSAKARRPVFTSNYSTRIFLSPASNSHSHTTSLTVCRQALLCTVKEDKTRRTVLRSSPKSGLQESCCLRRNLLSSALGAHLFCCSSYPKVHFINTYLPLRPSRPDVSSPG